jgi:hypothetical protein
MRQQKKNSPVRVCESESALAMPSLCDVKCASEQRWSCRAPRKVLSERCRKDTREKQEKKRANNIEGALRAVLRERTSRTRDATRIIMHASGSVTEEELGSEGRWQWEGDVRSVS